MRSDRTSKFRPDRGTGSDELSRGLPYRADPSRAQAGAINHHDDGRGVCFDDPDRHLPEVITRPYGSGGRDP